MGKRLTAGENLAVGNSKTGGNEVVMISIGGK